MVGFWEKNKMPYIKPKLREVFDKEIDTIVSGLWMQERNGEAVEEALAYVISRLLHRYLRRLKYADLNCLIGTLECVKLELYQQLLRPYGDLKRTLNGAISKWDR